MANCFHHQDVEAEYFCKTCWMNFCKSCFNIQTQTCNNCASKPAVRKEQPIRKSILIFAALGLLISLMLLPVLIVNSPKQRINTEKNRTAINARKSQGSNPNKTYDDEEVEIIVNGSLNAQELRNKSLEYYSEIPAITYLPKGIEIGLKTITVNIYKNKKDYVAKTGKPSWSEGFADYKNNEVHIVQSKGLLDSMLPHEISHLFFDSYIGYENNDFNWVDEGLATFIQVKYDPNQGKSFSGVMKKIRDGNYIPIIKFANYLQETKDTDNINKYYAQTLSIVEFLKDDSNKWTKFLSSLKSGAKFERALVDAYEITPDSLEKAWFNYIKNNKQKWEKTG